MVLLVERLSKLYCRLENHHHHHSYRQPAALSASLQAFRSDVWSHINQLFLNSEHGGLEILTLEWIQKCFQVVPFINKAFAKLVVEIDYHMNQWEAKSMEAYFDYRLDLLDVLNSITSSLSCLIQTRLSLTHALSLAESSPSLAIQRLMVIEFKGSECKNFKDQDRKKDDKERSSSGKEGVVLQALKELRSVGLWLSSIVLAGLSGNAKLYLDMRKSTGMLTNPSLMEIDSIICGVVMEKGCVLMEVEELKDSAVLLVAGGDNDGRDITEKMQRKMEAFGCMLDELRKEVNSVFSEVLASRFEMLNGIRFQK